VTGEAARCTDTAAEAIRALNYATLPAAGTLTGPADVYDVVGALATLTGRLPQVLSQLQAFLAGEHAAGRVRIVDGPHTGDPAAALVDVQQWLTCSSSRADALREALEQVHAALSWTAGPNQP
jgi:hypothetical protein